MLRHLLEQQRGCRSAGHNRKFSCLASDFSLELESAFIHDISIAVQRHSCNKLEIKLQRHNVMEPMGGQNGAHRLIEESPRKHWLG
jgi:hypothetical protein